ncbi:hypothetical protein [Jatrophihabitans sp.]|uniref:hypothetical protein n=1 Tax=Jatrophihabitans sp. TaxID=1932789 RepID=UPI002BDA4428|nr:hypothetical protein [Jatrophihabitans sp.]
MRTGQDLVFEVWCRLTGNSPDEFGPEEREAFRARPQVAELARSPYPVLLHAGVTVARGDSLPLERWLGAVRRERLLSA